jgi:hypothetical protein
LFFRAPEEKNAEQQHTWESPGPVKKKDPPIGRCWGETFGGLTSEKGGKKKKTKERVRQLGDFL